MGNIEKKIKPAKVTRAEIVHAAKGELAEVPPTEHFHSPVRPEVYNHLMDQLLYTGVLPAAGGSLSVLGGLLVNNVAIIATAGSVTFAGVAIFLVGMNGIYKRQRRVLEKFKAWAKARYGIDLSNLDANENQDLMIQVSYHHKDLATLPLKDAGGNTLMLVGQADSFHFEQPGVSGGEKALQIADRSLTKEQVREFFKSLPGETAPLFGRVIQQAAQLHEQDLTVEQTHVLVRVEQDLDELHTTWRRLAKLGDASDAAVINMRDTLVMFGAELKQVSDQVRDGLERELRVQRTYVESRKEGSDFERALLDLGRDADDITGIKPIEEKTA